MHRTKSLESGLEEKVLANDERSITPVQPNPDDPSPGDDSDSRSSVPRGDSPWAPLAVPIFRTFWIASIVSNLGTWIHEVGAGWLMTQLDPSPEMVSAVRVTISSPTMLLAIPAGVLADRMDRRRLLIVTQWVLVASAASLSILTALGWITSWGLLALTLVTGMGMVLHILTWQSTIPILVPRPQLSRAIALGSISFNLARAAGPAIGGFLVATLGAWIAFAINGLSFLVVLDVLWKWKPEKTEAPREQVFMDSLREGFRFVLGQRKMRNVLLNLMLFLMPATAMWSLLPLLAHQHLGWTASGYGLLVTAFGIGAVCAAQLMHRLHRRLKHDRTIALAMLLFAVAWLVMAVTSLTSIILLAAVVMGACWMLTMTTLNAGAQLALPNHLRARGMGSYLTVVAGSMAMGSLLWGQVAGEFGLIDTQKVAAAILLVAAAVSLRFPVD